MLTARRGIRERMSECNRTNPSPGPRWPMKAPSRSTLSPGRGHCVRGFVGWEPTEAPEVSCDAAASHNRPSVFMNIPGSFVSFAEHPAWHGRPGRAHGRDARATICSRDVWAARGNRRAVDGLTRRC